MNKFKDKCNVALKYIDKFFNSDWFIVFFAGMVLLSWAVECEYIALVTGIVSLIYMFLTQENLDRVALVALTLPAFVDNNMRHRINLTFIIVVACLLLLVVASGVYHFLKVHKKNDRKIINSTFFFVYILAVVASGVGGIGYGGHTFIKALIVIGLNGALLGLYVLLYKGGSEKLKDNVVKGIVALAGIIVAEMLIYFSRQTDLTQTLVSKVMSLGWAITNSVAVMLALAIPFCFYLAKGKKIQLPYMLLGSIFLCFIFLTNCRSMMFVGLVIYLICVVLSFITLNRWQALLSLVIFGIFGAFAVTRIYDRIFYQFMNMGLDDNGRLEIYSYYFSQFKENPLFGMGFFSDTFLQTDGMVRAHNTPIQILVSMGLFGVICAIPFYFKRYKAFLTKRSWFKLFAFISYLAMAGYGMVDCAMISSYKLISVYMLMLAVEFDTLEQTPVTLPLISK